MDTILGLFGVLLFVVGVIALAAAVTFLTIKLSPARDTPKSKPDSESA